MDWTQSIQNAIDYVEEHITEELRYEEIAKRAFSSTYHFQRMFGLTCGLTLGEYIRKRRLTLAANELLKRKAKIIDIALQYGYDTPESFSRAFQKFHGILPSQVKNNSCLKSFSKLSVQFEVGGKEMHYKIESRNELTLVGYKKRFTGVPYGEERAIQEENFCKSTRAKQWLLLGASSNYENDYFVITNIDNEGYDFYIAYELDEWTRKALFDPNVTGVDFIDRLEFEILTIPKNDYVIFKTEKAKRPIGNYVEMRKRIVKEWLPDSIYQFRNAPELTVMHWRPKGEWAKERYIEICLPVEKRTEER